ncbi:MAG: PEP-CTERM sorting domain-containing protein [Planctomycetota bacterium]|jgi:hypothetical protein
MMRKLLVLTMVLCLASMASATLQVSIGVDQNPVDSELTVDPGATVDFGIWTDAAVAAFENVTWALVVDDAEGTVTGGAGLVSGFNVMGAFQDQTWAPAGLNGVFGGYLGPMVGGPVAGDDLYDSFVLTAGLATADATVELWSLTDIGGGDWALDAMLDSAVVHVPEPMTMALLGLGGLFLRRRK